MNMRLQSALEYLTTYSWVLLVIAVALIVLFNMGLFNGNLLSPKALPGSCQVVRPSGLEVTQQPSLLGSCNGEMPKYVASFNHADSYMKTSVGDPFSGAGGFTVTGWVYLYGGTLGGPCEGGILGNWNGASLGFQINAYSCQGKIAYISGCCTASTTVSFPPGASSTSLPYGKWVFFAVAYNSANGAALSDLNNQFSAQSLTSGLTFGSSSSYYIGSYAPNPGFGVNGMLSNVQLYNTSLSENALGTVYNRGIGGAPIDLYSLVGWWPVNGDANDYSGNSNEATASNVVYNSNWYAAYSQP